MREWEDKMDDHRTNKEHVYRAYVTEIHRNLKHPDLEKRGRAYTEYIKIQIAMELEGFDFNEIVVNSLEH